MKELFTSFFRISVFTSIIFMIFGLLLFFNPGGVIVTISCIIGAFLIMIGVSGIIMYFKDRIYFRSYLITGLFSLIFGIILIMNTNIIATIIPNMIGICMIGLGIKKFDLSLNFKDNQVEGWFLMLIMAIVTFIFGIVLVLNPLQGAFLATKVVGLIIVIYSVMDIIDSVVLKKNIQKIHKIIEQ